MAKTDSPTPGDAGTKAPPSGGRTAEELRSTADSIRSRLDLFGKSLAGLATVGTTAVGLNKIGDLFPTDDNGWAAALACGGLAAAAIGTLAIAVRLMTVSRPVFISADTAQDALDNDDEREAVRPVLADAARRFGYTSMNGLQEYERGLRVTAAAASDPAAHDQQIQLADDVKTEIEQALARSQVVIVRDRATQAVSNRSAWALYMLFVAGLILFAVGADKVSSERHELGIAQAKACAEARKAGATQSELERTKKICDPNDRKKAPPASTEPLTSAEARAQITAKLVAALTSCTAQVHKAGKPGSGPLAGADCKPVSAAVTAMLPSSP